MIDAARLRIACAERKVYRAAHFLIKEDIFRAAMHVEVVPKGKFSQAARTLVHSQHFLKVILTLCGSSFDDNAMLETQSHIFDRAAAVGCREAEADVPIRRIFHRAGKKLTAGEVVFPIAIDKHTICNRELQVGVLAAQVNGALAFEPLYETPLLSREFLCRRSIVGAVS